MQIQNSYHW